jgi:type IV pilus assembly protein PilC
MAVYEYTARDENGNRFDGTYSNIGSVALLRKELDKTGDTLLKARRRKLQSVKRTRIKQNEIVTFAYKFAGMCSAGLSIIRCLETLEEQTDNQSFKQVLSDVTRSVSTGSTLKDAFEKHRKIFSDFFLGMVEAGESGGRLSQTLEMSAIYLEKRADLKRKLQSVFAYPLVVGIMSIIVVACLVVFVVPIFSKLYTQMHVSLPLPTQALVGVSTLAREWWWAVLVVVAGSILLWKALSENTYIKAGWDTFKLNLPVFAKLNRMVVVSHFIRTFAMMASAGVSLIKALDVADLVVHNSKISEIAGQLQKSIKAGNPVAASLKNHDIFTPMIVQLAASGEEAGTLSEMLNKGADFLDKDIDRAIKAILVKLEPVMTLIMGAIVGFILMGVYLPMFDYMAHLE